MFKICWHCKNNYIEEDEEVCVDCAIFFAEENEYDHYEELFVEEFLDKKWLGFHGSITLKE